MKNYLSLQLKRQIKLLPLVLGVTLVLFVGISTILTMLINSFNSDEDQQMFKIAITGDTDDEYISLGLAAVQTIDDTRFTLEFLELEEDEAKKCWKRVSFPLTLCFPKILLITLLRGKWKRSDL